MKKDETKAKLEGGRWKMDLNERITCDLVMFHLQSSILALNLCFIFANLWLINYGKRN